jgi:hypothetical protein
LLMSQSLIGLHPAFFHALSLESCSERSPVLY